MVTLIDWEPVLAQVDAALLTATGEDRTQGQEIRDRLQSFGLMYDEHRIQSVDGRTPLEAKDQQQLMNDAAIANWAATATPVHQQADEAARHVLDIVGEAPPALPFDETSSASIINRLNSAAAALTAGTGFTAEQLNYLPGFISAQRLAVQAAYAAKPTLPIEIIPYDKTVYVTLYSRGGTVLYRNLTFRQIDTLLQDAYNDATTWLAAVAYP